MPNYYNVEIFESVASGSTTLNLQNLSSKIVITNDDSSNDLLCKPLAGGPTWLTLKPNETLDIEFATSAIAINGTNNPCRIWVFS